MIDSLKDKTIYNKLKKDANYQCPVCGEYITTNDAKDVEYIKTKRGTELFIHTECVKKWGE